MWMFAIRWVMRLLSVINIAILARLLGQAGLRTRRAGEHRHRLTRPVLTDLGVEQAIISERAPSAVITIRPGRSGPDSARTSGVVHLPGRPVDRHVLRRRADRADGSSALDDVVLKGIENIWTVSFRKELDFWSRLCV